MGYLILIKPSSRCSPDAWMRFVGLRGMNLLGSRGGTPGGIQRIADARAEQSTCTTVLSGRHSERHGAGRIQVLGFFTGIVSLITLHSLYARFATLPSRRRASPPSRKGPRCRLWRLQS